MRQLKLSNESITHRGDNTSRYFTDVSRRNILSPDEEFKIGTLAAQGDEKAINTLISANLRFVVSVAKQYSNQYVMLDELICQGNIGLCDAARTFDPTRGFKFISYAVWHIRKEILMYLNTYNRSVRVPQNIKTDLAKIRKVNESILQEEGRYGTVDEIHDELVKRGTPLSTDHISKVLSADTAIVPIDFSASENDFSPIDYLSSDEKTTTLVDESDESAVINIALSRLTVIQRDIVVSRLGLNGKEAETLSTIGERYNKTSEWARSIYVKSLKIMRSKLNRAQLTQDKVLNHEI